MNQQVKVTQSRNGQTHEWDVFYSTPQEAAKKLLVYELGYGGHITTLSETSLTVKTIIMRCVDETKFEGSKEAMSLLLDIAALWFEAKKLMNEDQAIERMLEVTQGKALWVTHFGFMLMGHQVVSALLAVVAGHPELVQQFQNLPLNSALAAAELLIEGYPVSEVQSLI